MSKVWGIPGLAWPVVIAINRPGLHRTVVLALLFALGLSACGVTREEATSAEPAGTVTWPDGQSTEIAEVEGTIAEIEASEVFTPAVLSDIDRPLLVAELASLRVIAATQQRVLDTEGGIVTAEALETAQEGLRTQYVTVIGEEDVDAALAEVPGLVGLLVELDANDQALAEVFADGPGQDAPCVRHILVEDEALAQDLISQLAEGADFASLAMENSIDPGSGAAGGELGCVPTSSWVPEFAEAVDNAEIGEVVGPVQSQFGFHIIEVTGLETIPADAGAAADAALQVALLEAEVTLDPTLGEWDSEGLQVVPAET